ncbi:MAG TPA: GNAT family N-acetyltransferase, partial [Silvibacterium sp.]|nr:GNAT family N-acetyltransferase [Silvibacterium sp.]
FFVVRGWRRRGIGTEIACEVWRRFPGRWEVRVMESNHAALRFWEHAVTKFAGEAVDRVLVERGGQEWHLFSFESKGL